MLEVCAVPSVIFDTTLVHTTDEGVVIDIKGISRIGLHCK